MHIITCQKLIACWKAYPDVEKALKIVKNEADISPSVVVSHAHGFWPTNSPALNVHN